MARAIAASESEMVTVAMKRIDMNNPQDDMLVHVRRPEIQLLPNTSGVRDAEEAVLAAQLAREAFGTNFIKPGDPSRSQIPAARSGRNAQGNRTVG